MAERAGICNILWSEGRQKKRWKNAKKGVDKGPAVWYISKALKRARRFQNSKKYFAGTVKKVLTKLNERDRIAEFAEAELG